jgi:hypothetical protein
MEKKQFKKQLLNLEEAAKLLRVTKEMVRRYVRAGLLVDIGETVELNVRHRITRLSVENFKPRRRGRPVVQKEDATKWRNL